MPLLLQSVRAGGNPEGCGHVFHGPLSPKYCIFVQYKGTKTVCLPLHLSAPRCTLMFFADVTFLMRNGLRLKPSERMPAARYTVTILESDRDKNNSARNLVVANLYVSYGTAQMAGRGCLVDPDILAFKGPGFLLFRTAPSEIPCSLAIWRTLFTPAR